MRADECGKLLALCRPQPTGLRVRYKPDLFHAMGRPVTPLLSQLLDKARNARLTVRYGKLDDVLELSTYYEGEFRAANRFAFLVGHNVLRRVGTQLGHIGRRKNVTQDMLGKALTMLLLPVSSGYGYTGVFAPVCSPYIEPFSLMEHFDGYAAAAGLTGDEVATVRASIKQWYAHACSVTVPDSLWEGNSLTNATDPREGSHCAYNNCMKPKHDAEGGAYSGLGLCEEHYAAACELLSKPRSGGSAFVQRGRRGHVAKDAA